MSANADRSINWANLHNLRLNVDKTKAMVIGSPRYVNSLPTIARSFIDIGGTPIVYESSLRNLGVVLDSKLNWNEHIAHICRRVRALIYRLYYFRKSTNLRLHRHLIQMLLFPVVDYCCVVYNNLSKYVNSRLQPLVNSGIHYIYGLKRWEHITPYRRELGWLTTTARMKYFAANLLRKIFNTATPSYLLAFFDFTDATRPVRGDMKPLDIRGFGTETLKKIIPYQFCISLEFTTIRYP